MENFVLIWRIYLGKPVLKIRVKFLGMLPSKQLVREINSAAFLAAPSRWRDLACCTGGNVLWKGINYE